MTAQTGSSHSPSGSGVSQPGREDHCPAAKQHRWETVWQMFLRGRVQKCAHCGAVRMEEWR